MDTERTLASRYQLVAHLARGGMADVFEAEDRLLNRRVAIKVLHAQFASDQAFVHRFRREAQAAANLSHPNIVSIYDWGYDSGTYFMVMELIKGRTLRDIVRTEGALLPRRAAEICAEVAAALAVAHRSSLSHRDVKPGNIMLTPDGTVKVTDFGIARALDDSEELTRTGAVIGTATYFSPEQAQGIPADGRSDIYSLGVVLFELLLAQPPFTGESPVAVAYQHVSEYPPAPRSIDPEVPAALEEIVLRAMEKDPRDRYQSADDMRADLLRYLRGETPAAAMAAPQPAPATPPMDPGYTEVMQQPPPATVPPDETARHVAYVEEERAPIQYGFVIGVILLVAVLAGGVWILFQLLASDPAVTTVAVPNVAGQDSDAASIVLREAGLRVAINRVPDDAVASGVVIATDPAAGAEVEPNSSVQLIVSSGPAAFPVPNVTGQDFEDARQALESNGFEVTLDTESSLDVAEGVVISQDPAGGADASPGSTVTVVVSTGPDAIEVPDLTGVLGTTAAFQLAQAGFAEEQVEIVEEFSGDVEEGRVIRTEPAAGELVGPSTTIMLFVSSGLPDVPDLTGRTVVEARQILSDLDLVLELDSNTVLVDEDSGLDGLIAAQDPAAGTLLDPGSTVIVQLGQLLRILVPEVVGLSQADAQAAVEAVGLAFQVGDTVEVDPTDVGLVISQDPAAGTEIPADAVVNVVVGVARVVAVPSLIGVDEAAARGALEAVGLVLALGDPVEDAASVGLVVSQDPAAGTEVDEGTTVTVSLGIEPPTTTTTTKPGQQP